MLPHKRLFQSTLPVWGATDVPRGCCVTIGVFQSTLPVWGATVGSNSKNERKINFNPRSPCGERQVYFMLISDRIKISIHAPRVGSDLKPELVRASSPDFNPRSPCGERLHIMDDLMDTLQFQSTLPVWGATFPDNPIRDYIQISIHAPRVGSDAAATATTAAPPNFNPRSPCGERPGYFHHLRRE